MAPARLRRLARWLADARAHGGASGGEQLRENNEVVMVTWAWSLRLDRARQQHGLGHGSDDIMVEVQGRQEEHDVEHGAGWRWW